MGSPEQRRLYESLSSQVDSLPYSAPELLPSASAAVAIAAARYAMSVGVPKARLLDVLALLEVSNG